MLVPLPRAASRRLMSFLTFQISICTLLSASVRDIGAHCWAVLGRGDGAILVRRNVRSSRLRSGKMSVSVSQTNGGSPMHWVDAEG